ncbi:UNVERIFIED_CONTAM: hypothetical protein GTU68_056391 [Idotea baltica]|nr:hypothetical protein [Idotea baltica]
MSHLTTDTLNETEKSKSQVKRDLHDLQKLGQRLTLLPTDKLKLLPLTETLLKAIQESSKHTSHLAKKRHYQFIGKLMRNQDIEAINQFLEKIDTASRQNNDYFKSLERWRDDLINGNANVLADFISKYPETDRQHLRQLLRLAQQEAKQEKAPVAARKLFKYVRSLCDAQNGLI